MDVKEKKFFAALEAIFIGAQVEGESGFINLMRIKQTYYQKGIFPRLQKDIADAVAPFPEFREELFDRLYAFFHRYFSESGSIYFRYTPLHEKVYEQVYTDDRDVMLFWKTHMLYYVKSERLYQNMTIKVGDVSFFFDVSKLEHKKTNVKNELVYEFKEVKKDNGALAFFVTYSTNGKKTRNDDILKNIRKEKIVINEDTLETAFSVFEKQSEVDFFINKDAKGFLVEQFDMWLYQYVFEPEQKAGTAWSEKRIQQLQVLKVIAYCIIDFIAQFEDELGKIWRKPKFIRRTQYVVTADRILREERGAEVLGKLLTHPGINQQIDEWVGLKLVTSKFTVEDIFTQGGKAIKAKYRFLPFDTKYFQNLKYELLEIFKNLDAQTDGCLIHSDNYQALLSIQQKYESRVKMIYIDPPFNKDQEADYFYSVKYKDSTWISLLQNRMELARDLIHEKGCIFVRCDNNGNMFIRLLLSEIFGQGNFRNELMINRFKKKSNGFTNTTESLFLFSKSELFDVKQLVKPRECIFCLQPIEPEWQWSHSAGASDTPKYFMVSGVRTLLYPPKGRHWTNSQDEIDRLESLGRIRIDFETTYRDSNGNVVEFIPEKLQDSEVVIDDNWTDIPGYEFGVYTLEKFSTQNSETLLKRVIETSTVEQELVMDFFLGSGTTVAVAHKLNRKWIGIENGDHFDTIVVPRLKRVLFHDRSGISKDIEVGKKYNNDNAGGLFKYFEVEQYEDVLKRLHFSESDPIFFQSDIYSQYVFLRDPKLMDNGETGESVVTPSSDDERMEVDLYKLYPDIDLAETLSCITGKWIRRIHPRVDNPSLPGEVEFEDGTRVSLVNPPWELIKPLVWW